MKDEKIDMSPEAVTDRLKTMEQLWELSINLMNAKEVSETALLSEKSLGKDWNSKEEKEFWEDLEKLQKI